MKKLSTDEKEYLLICSVRKHRHEFKRKQKRRRLKKARTFSNVIKKRNTKFVKNYKSSKHKELVAPSVFSLLKDPGAVVNFFMEAKDSFARKIPVFFDLSQVTEMGPETLTYLTALVTNKNFTGEIACRGNAPASDSLRKMFRKAGFYDFLKPDREIPKELSADINNKLIHRETHEKVESDLAGEVCLSAMQHTFKSSDFTKQNFFPILIECMANTHNHAGGGEQIYNWWLLAYKEPNTRITKFCFLDLGVGIFGSLKKKYGEGKLPEKLVNVFKPGHSNKTILRQIFGGSKKTVTEGLQGRGQGIEHIYKKVHGDETIQNFTMMSNNVIARLGYNTSDIIKTLGTEFGGTMYYWELVPKP